MFSRYLELVFYRAFAELRTEASRAYLGVLWWVLEPTLYMLVFYTVFGLGLRQGDHMFVPFLLCGLIPWKWLDGSVRSASGIIAMSVGLMHQVYLPKWVLPMVILVANTYKFLIILALLLLFLIGFGAASWSTWGYLPVLVLSQAIMVFAMAMTAAALVPLVPDLRHVVNNGMTFVFFLSGIFYKVEYLTADIQAWLAYNPVLVLIEAYRDVLLYGQAPDWAQLLPVNGVMLAASGLAWLFLHRMDRVYPRVVA